MRGEIGRESKLVTGAPSEKKKMTTLLVSVNEDLAVQTYNERSSSSRDRRCECICIRVSSRVKNCESDLRRTSKKEHCVKTLVN